jgi:hypothetical protein
MGTIAFIGSFSKQAYIQKEEVNMRSRLVITFVLVFTSLLLLTACGSEAENTYPGADEPISSPEDGEAYPNPDNELYLPITGSNPAYPAPELDDQTGSDSGVVDPYPGVGDSGNPELVINFNDLSPVSSDKNLTSGTVYIESSDLTINNDDPGKVEVVITGNLPTPCHKLRVKVAEPTADGRIDINAYTVTDPEKMCIQVLVPFETSIPLSDLVTGDYTLFLNEKQAGSFEIP